MGTEKRDRQKANRAARIEAERAAAAKARRNQTIRNVVIVGIVLVVLMVLASVLSGCGSNSDTTRTGDAPSSSAPKVQSSYGAGPCPPEGGASGARLDFDDAPKRCIDPAKTYTAKVETTEGNVLVELDTTATPVTTNNFVTLARYGYFDDTDLFRTEAASGIIQGGSPHTQDNSDQGPGYVIPDEGTPFAAADYGPGTLAMANAGPGTASAQFFFLASDGGRYLGDPAQVGDGAGSYTVFGRVTSGMDVLAKIAKLDDGTGKPSKKVTITQVIVRTS